MGYNEDLTLLLKEVRDRLASIEELLAAVPAPCEAERGGVQCSLAASHQGWHLTADGRAQWLDD